MHTIFVILLAAISLVSPLPSSTWDYSEWISAADAPVISDIVNSGSRAADGSSWFVCPIKCEKSVNSAIWMTTGLGIYQLYVDTVLIGDEVLKPGFTHYAKTKRSFSYDISSLIKGKNEFVLSAQVTPGWWADKIITPSGAKGMYGQKCAFRAVLKLEYKDGTMQYIGTDTLQWRAGIAGPVKHADIFDGEEYDSREPMGYELFEKLSKPIINSEFHGEILPTNGAEVYLRRDLTLEPHQAYVYKDVTYADAEHYGQVVIDRDWSTDTMLTLMPGETLVVDFGQNCAAVPEFVFEADKGTILTCLPGEMINDSLGAKKRGMDGPEGSVYRSNLRIPDAGMQLRYTFSDQGSPVIYHPMCTFFGYRYISVIVTGKVHIRSIQSIPISSITPEMEIGHITTGDSLVNRLILNTIWGQRSNYLSIPTDCPQRDERLGWTADTQVFCETGTYFANTNAFFRKWLRDLRDSQKENGGYPGVAPFGQYGSNPEQMARVGWSDAGIIVPWIIWKQFGDTSLIKEHWISMEKYIDHGALVRFDHKALIDDNDDYQWGDWLSYEPLESHSGKVWDSNGQRPEAPEYWSFLYGSYWIIDAGMMLEMARAIGKDTTKYVQMIAEAKTYVKERFLLPDGSFRLEVLNTMQTPALFALHNNLLEGQAKTNMIEHLRANFLEHEQCLQTGFLGTSILMQTLTDNGMVDIAYDLLFQRRNPSWLYSVDNGATTIWERWDSYTREKGLASNGMNSFNHYAYGCVCQWLWQTAAGIQADPLQPGFRHFILAPQPDKRLGFVNAEYHSASGVIQSEWNYNDAICNWNFSIPEGTSATVIINGKKTEYTAGKWSLSIPEVLNEIETDKSVCFKIMRDGILLIKTPNGLFNAIGQKYEH